jgi:hypothetical protein
MSKPPVFSVAALQCYMRAHKCSSGAAYKALSEAKADRAKTPRGVATVHELRAYMAKHNVTAAQAANELRAAEDLTPGESHQCPLCGAQHAAPGGEDVDPDDAAGVVARKGSAEAKRKASDAEYGRNFHATRDY